MEMRLDRAGLLRRMAAMICPGGDFLSGPCAHADGATVCRSRLCLTAAQWVAGLPALGDVLYLSGQMDCAWQQRLSPGLLVECAELGPLLQTRALVAAGAITPDGPREWIECLDAGDRVLARLYLLPDTDYLAWDALHAAAGTATDDATRGPSWRPASARLLRFRVRHLAGLQVLGAEAGVGASPLGRELAARIARDEVVSG